jgi:uncharacterized membrane protein (Fun14 family)
MTMDPDDSASPTPHCLGDSLLVNAPWTSKSFLAACATTIGGVASWLADISSPAVAKMGGSFVLGFLIGWVFSRLLKMAALVTGFLLASLVALNVTGWAALDWVVIEQQLSQSFRWLQGEADGLKHLLTGYLPSAGAGGIGVLFGFRRK